jgi:hypothetical protein
VADVAVEMPAEGESEPSPEEAMKAAFRAAIIAVVDDDSLDLDTQKEKIGALLDKKAEAEEVAGGGEAAAEETAASESLKAADVRNIVREEYRAVRQETLLEEVLVRNRLALNEFTDSQRRILRECASAEEIEQALVAWGAIRRSEPASFRPIQEAEGEPTYDHLFPGRSARLTE